MPPPGGASAAAPDRSLRFPPGASTSSVAKSVLSRSTVAAGTVHASQVADAVLREDKWRWQYHRHAVNHVRACADATPDTCAEMARAGLDALHGSLVFGEGGGTLREALEERRKGSGGSKRNSSGGGGKHGGFTTGRVAGAGHRTVPRWSDLTLPVGERVLRGAEVHAKLDEWSEKGVIEPDTAAAVRNLRPSEDLDLASSEWVFVVMGAGAAMGPLMTLLKLGATVIAVDLPIPAVWGRLVETADRSPGTLLFPMRREDSSDSGDGDNSDIVNVTKSNAASLSSRAGCNLLTQIPELIDWLVARCPEKRLVLGSYAYLDSAAFVRVSLAMDAVASETLRERPDSALAYLCSPTDVFAVPPGARDAAALRAADKDGKTRFQRLASALLPRGRILDPNTVPSTRPSSMPLVDALVLQQGPNYFLAKRLQHWRVMLEARRRGTIVSSNVAPASNTRSVLKNRLLAAAYAGAHHFGPVEIFDPETSNVLMTYLLLHDLRAGKEREEQRRREGAAGPPFSCLSLEGRTDLVDHPLNIFATTPVHNGIWRCGYQIRSLLELVVAYYFVDKVRAPAVAAAAVGVGAAILRSRM